MFLLVPVVVVMVEMHVTALRMTLHILDEEALPTQRLLLRVFLKAIRVAHPRQKHMRPSNAARWNLGMKIAPLRPLLLSPSFRYNQTIKTTALVSISHETENDTAKHKNNNPEGPR